MNRRQLVFIILVNALISLAIALTVAWAIEARRPDLEELAFTTQGAGAPAPVVVTTPVVAAPPPIAVVGEQPPATAAPEIAATVVISGESQIYIVQTGDSVGGIAAQFNVAVADLIAVNPELRKNPDLVFSGLPLTIPEAGAASEVTQSPTLASETPTTALLIAIDHVETPGNLLSEAVQIVNNDQREINLNGWQLRRENGPSHTFGNLPLFPGSGIWLHSRAGTDTSVAVYWQQSSAVWASGALVQLVNPDGIVVTSYLVP